jgi:alpha/beta superfamily hydrolase
MTRLGGQESLQKLEKDGFLDIKDGAGNVEYRVTKESLEDRLSTDMNAACLAIPKECRVLTVHGAKDEVVPVEDAYKFSQKISTHSLSILNNANHGYRSHQCDLAQCILDFVKDG